MTVTYLLGAQTLLYFLLHCRVLMQKVAKELLGMLSWPAITARTAAAEAAAAPLAAGNLAALSSSSSAGSGSVVNGGAGAAAGQPAGLNLQVLRKMLQVGVLGL